MRERIFYQSNMISRLQRRLQKRKLARCLMIPALAWCGVKLVAAAVSIEVAAAQDSKAPKEFFDQDYAKSPLKSDSGVGVPREGRKPRNRATPQVAPNPAGGKASTPDGSKADAVAADDAPADNSSALGALFPREGKSLPIVRIGVILNTLNQQHASEVLDELSALATKYDYEIGTIFSIGNPGSVAHSDAFMKLLLRGAKLHDQVRVPEAYNAVRLSPTWIVQTQDGQVLLEATGPLKSFLNERGELLL